MKLSILPQLLIDKLMLTTKKPIPAMIADDSDILVGLEYASEDFSPDLRDDKNRLILNEDSEYLQVLNIQTNEFEYSILFRSVDDAEIFYKETNRELSMLKKA